MKPRSDLIPVLPAMPYARRRRRRSHGPWIVLIIAVAAVCLIAMAITIKARFRKMADDSFRRAEEHFQSGAFGNARQEYELFLREYPRDPRASQAKSAGELSKIAQSINDELADPRRVIEGLEEYARQARDEPAFANRWPVIMTIAQRTSRTMLEKAIRSLESDDMESGDAWLAWLREQQNKGAAGTEQLEVAELTELAVQARYAISLEKRRQSFLMAVDRAVSQRSAQNFSHAFRAYDDWLAETKEASDATVTVQVDRLHKAMRAQVQFQPAPLPEKTGPPLPLLPLGPYSALSVRAQLKMVPSSDRPAFARAKDLCYALDASTGSPRWVARVGYDAPLPEWADSAGEPSVLITWSDGHDTILSLCDARNGETHWSWVSPDHLAGPPAVSRDAVYVATETGMVWHLDLEHGSPRGLVELPEAIDSAPRLRDDGRGLCVIGAERAIYFFDIAREQPECVDLALVGRRPDTTQCQITWAPPYVLLFENDLVNRCFVRVLYQEPSGHRQVRQIELDGRVWQPPVLDGADVLVITDRWKTHCFGLDPGNPAVNLYTAATHVGAAPEMRQPARPYAARISELPFVFITDALHGVRPDRAQGLIREIWKRPLPHPEARAVQPIQVVGGLIIASFHEPGSDGVLLQAFAIESGELIWQTRLGHSARDVAVVRESPLPMQAVARTDSGHVFLIQFDAASHAQSQLLSVPSPFSTVHHLPATNELVYVGDSGTAIHVVSTQEWSRAAEPIRTPVVASELTLLDGTIVVRAGSDPVTRRGRWVLYITADRTLMIRPIYGSADDIHGVRLPVPASGDLAWSWPPIASENSGIIVAHPQGELCRVEVRATDGIIHLLVVEQRDDLSLIQAPIPMGDRLFGVTRESRCVLLDSKTLRTLADWQAPGAIRGAVADREQVYLALEDGTVRSLRSSGDSLREIWTQTVEGIGWSLAGVYEGRLLAIRPDGHILSLDKATGNKGATVQSPGPLGLLPRWAGGRLVVVTVDGGVFVLPAPAMQ